MLLFSKHWNFSGLYFQSLEKRWVSHEEELEDGVLVLL